MQKNAKQVGEQRGLSLPKSPRGFASIQLGLLRIADYLTVSKASLASARDTASTCKQVYAFDIKQVDSARLSDKRTRQVSPVGTGT